MKDDTIRSSSFELNILSYISSLMNCSNIDRHLTRVSFDCRRIETLFAIIFSRYIEQDSIRRCSILDCYR
jgi:hypothetical protein